MDVSTGTKQTEQAADFPNGVPCASDASMGQWMSYVYQQQPLPTNFTGVTVQLAAIDPNGNHIVIGNATTNVDGVFDYAWAAPNIPGSYSIYATFYGTNGYYGSNANTGVYVESAVVTTQQPTASPVTGLATDVRPYYWNRCSSNRHNHRNRHSRLTHTQKKAIKMLNKNNFSPFLVLKNNGEEMGLSRL